MTPDERKRNLQLALVTLTILSLGLFVMLRVNEPASTGNAVSLANPILSRPPAPVSPLIAYVREVQVEGQSYSIPSLNVVRCLTDSCSRKGTIHSLASSGNISGVSMTRAPNGNPLIFFQDAYNLKVASCADSSCTSAAIYTIDPSIGIYNSSPTSAGITGDGMPIVAYYDLANKNLKVAHCTNIQCSASTTAVIDSEGDVGSMPAMMISSARKPFIVYLKKDPSFDSIMMANCLNFACTSAETSLLITSHGFVVGDYLEMKRGSDGLPLIAFYGGGYGAGDLKVIHCNTPTCEQNGGISNTVTTVDSEGDTGRYPQIVFGSDGLPMIFYQFVLGYVGSALQGYDVKTARCLNVDCSQSVKTHFLNAELFGYNLIASRNPVTNSFLLIGQNRHTQGGDADLFAMNCVGPTCAQMTSPLTLDDPSNFPGDHFQKGYSNAVMYV